MMKQTAVEWLALYIKGITSLNCDEVIQQAKEMEKEQINNAHYEGSENYRRQYYNETFKSE